MFTNFSCGNAFLFKIQDWCKKCRYKFRTNYIHTSRLKHTHESIHKCTCNLYHLHILLYSLQSVQSNVEVKLYVQLQEYSNEYNLKYRPEKTATPHCCCSTGSPCFTSTDNSNLTFENFTGQCALRFTLCAELANVTMKAEEGMSDTPGCYLSEIKPTPPLVEFGLSSSRTSYFPNQWLFPHFSFRLENQAQSVSPWGVLGICKISFGIF